MQNFPWGLKKHPEHALYQTALHMKCCLFHKQLYTFTRGVISVSCPLITDLWEAKKRSDSYHKDISITIKVHGIFDIPTPYPETLTLERMLPYIFPLFGCLVSHLESISTLRRKLLLFIRNFLKKKSCCPLPLPRKVYCSITTRIKLKCRDMFTVRAAAQIGWAVAILLQSCAENRMLTLACCSHALPFSGFTLTQWHPARHKVYLHNTKSWDEPLLNCNVDKA